MDAATIEIKKRYAIFIDPSYFTSIKEIKEAIAHESGHCATGCTHAVSSPLDLIAKHEYKANRWMIERYLPFDKLNRAITSGHTETWDLADFFDVSERFIKKAIKYYTGPRGRKFG